MMKSLYLELLIHSFQLPKFSQSGIRSAQWPVVFETTTVIQHMLHPVQNNQHRKTSRALVLKSRQKTASHPLLQNLNPTVQRLPHQHGPSPLVAPLDNAIHVQHLGRIWHRNREAR